MTGLAFLVKSRQIKKSQHPKLTDDWSFVPEMISQTSGKTNYLFHQEGKTNWCAADFFLPLEPWMKTLLLCTTTTSDKPALLGREPNTSSAFE